MTAHTRSRVAAAIAGGPAAPAGSRPRRLSAAVAARWGGFALALAAGCWVNGCAPKGPAFNPYLPAATTAGQVELVGLTNRLSHEWLKPSTELFTLGPGDKLDIELIGDLTSRTQAVVGPDGKIYFHLLPGLDVWGLTLGEAKARIEKELANFIRDEVHVALTLRDVESKRVWLLGRFQQPGVYPMPAPMTVLEAIARAGGTVSLSGSRDASSAFTGEEIADLRRGFLVRKGRMVPVDFHRLLKEGDLSQNIYLQPDDFIFFPSATAREVYVMGAVASPRAVPYTANMTLAAAIANANGTIPDAYLRHVALVRGTLAQPRIAIINYREIVTGVRPDVALEPQDIVYVPFSPYRYLEKYANLILDTFVSSVAINEGTAAVIEQAPAAGVVIPIGPVGTTPRPVVPTR